MLRASEVQVPWQALDGVVLTLMALLVVTQRATCPPEGFAPSAMETARPTQAPWLAGAAEHEWSEVQPFHTCPTIIFHINCLHCLFPVRHENSIFFTSLGVSLR